MKPQKFLFGPIDQTWINRYAKESGDHNPIHLDKDFAKAAGLKTSIAHGMLSLGLATSALAKSGLRISSLIRLECKFKEMLYEGESLEAHITPLSNKQVQLHLQKTSGEQILSATAELKD